MDDSKAALIKAYGTIRERYNKLRLQYRQLLTVRVCLQCKQKRNVDSDIENSSVIPSSTSPASQRSQSYAAEIREICDHLTQIVEDVQIADSGGAVRGAVTRLQDVASRMATYEQQECVLTSGVSEVPSLAVFSSCQLEDSTDACSNKLQGSDAGCVGETAKDLESLASCKMCADIDHLDKNVLTDSAPWLSDLQHVAEMATSQYSELKGVCQNLKQQNKALKRLVTQLVCAKDDSTACEVGNVDIADGDWSLLEK